MPAYVSRDLSEFVKDGTDSLVARLHTAYASDGFSQQYTGQTRAWDESIPLLQVQLAEVLACTSGADRWRVLLEFPLYRLRKRVDAVVLTDKFIVVLEVKVGQSAFISTDLRQVEEYALDLRDFHAGSAQAPILPCLWCTEAPSSGRFLSIPAFGVAPVQELGRTDLAPLLHRLDEASAPPVRFHRESWDAAPYRPVPSVVEAATTLFAGHGVKEIAQADASNLAQAARRVIELIDLARRERKRALIFLTGVPGSGKTLAGLQVVHEAVVTGVEDRGDIVYLSGNTPLVTVLREALARDDFVRRRAAGSRARLADVRRDVRTRIQHIIDFLREYVTDQLGRPPHEHAIVFDEAQRAWDEHQGKLKFERQGSEPAMLLELMGRHDDWCALVCLVGGGQEINTGEEGIAGWGEALRTLSPMVTQRWTVFGPPQITRGDTTTGDLGIGAMPSGVELVEDESLRLDVPLRTFRSPRVSDWVAAVLRGDSHNAAQIAGAFDAYPIVVTRQLESAKLWLREHARGLRRFGLVASSGARRLRAEGLGVTLSATEGISIAQWYLNPSGDVRSSFALEVTANEFTTQGLELDFVGLCWGGDLLWSGSGGGRWVHRKFQGSRWVAVHDTHRRRFLENSYRVLLTRAREGLVIWVPTGDRSDPTRNPDGFDSTYCFLLESGAGALG